MADKILASSLDDWHLQLYDINEALGAGLFSSSSQEVEPGAILAPYNSISGVSRGIGFLIDNINDFQDNEYAQYADWLEIDVPSVGEKVKQELKDNIETQLEYLEQICANFSQTNSSYDEVITVRCSDTSGSSACVTTFSAAGGSSSCVTTFVAETGNTLCATRFSAASGSSSCVTTFVAAGGSSANTNFTWNSTAIILNTNAVTVRGSSVKKDFSTISANFTYVDFATGNFNHTNFSQRISFSTFSTTSNSTFSTFSQWFNVQASGCTTTFSAASGSSSCVTTFVAAGGSSACVTTFSPASGSSSCVTAFSSASGSSSCTTTFNATATFSQSNSTVAFFTRQTDYIVKGETIITNSNIV